MASRNNTSHNSTFVRLSALFCKSTILLSLLESISPFSTSALRIARLSLACLCILSICF